MFNLTQPAALAGNRLQKAGVILMRLTLAIIMVIHGAFRASQTGYVAGFGGYLTESGIPFGDIIAWILTLVEIFGGFMLAAGFNVVPLCVWFIIQLLVGIKMVHFQEGWFVVGGGRNGMEYSVVLILGFLSTILTHWPVQLQSENLNKG